MPRRRCAEVTAKRGRRGGEGGATLSETLGESFMSEAEMQQFPADVLPLKWEPGWMIPVIFHAD